MNNKWPPYNGVLFRNKNYGRALKRQTSRIVKLNGRSQMSDARDPILYAPVYMKCPEMSRLEEQKADHGLSRIGSGTRNFHWQGRSFKSDGSFQKGIVVIFAIFYVYIELYT